MEYESFRSSSEPVGTASDDYVPFSRPQIQTDAFQPSIRPATPMQPASPIKPATPIVPASPAGLQTAPAAPPAPSAPAPAAPPAPSAPAPAAPLPAQPAYAPAAPPAPMQPVAIPKRPSFVRWVLFPNLAFIGIGVILTLIAALFLYESSLYEAIIMAVALLMMVGPFFTIATLVAYFVKRAAARRFF